MLGEYPVETPHDVRRRHAVAAFADAHRDECGLLGDAVGGAAHSARHVGAVAVAVEPAITAEAEGVESRRHSAAEIHMAGVDARIDHVHPHSTARGLRGEGRRQGERTLVDAVDTPGWIGLGGVEPEGADRLDLGHPGIGCEFGHRFGVGCHDCSGKHRAQGRLDACPVASHRHLCGGQRPGLGEGINS